MEWRTQKPKKQHSRRAQQRMIVLAGLPGAGKSTLAQRLQSVGWVIINQVHS
jgi:adenylylsulfate kinase-like enzyme